MRTYPTVVYINYCDSHKDGRYYNVATRSWNVKPVDYRLEECLIPRQSGRMGYNTVFVLQEQEAKERIMIRVVDEYGNLIKLIGLNEAIDNKMLFADSATIVDYLLRLRHLPDLEMGEPEIPEYDFVRIVEHLVYCRYESDSWLLQPKEEYNKDKRWLAFKSFFRKEIGEGRLTEIFKYFPEFCVFLAEANDVVDSINTCLIKVEDYYKYEDKILDTYEAHASVRGYYSYKWFPLETHSEKVKMRVALDKLNI